MHTQTQTQLSSQSTGVITRNKNVKRGFIYMEIRRLFINTHFKVITLLYVHNRSIMTFVALVNLFKKARMPNPTFPRLLPRLLRFTGHAVEVLLYTTPQFEKCMCSKYCFLCKVWTSQKPVSTVFFCFFFCFVIIGSCFYGVNIALSVQRC